MSSFQQPETRSAGRQGLPSAGGVGAGWQAVWIILGVALILLGWFLPSQLFSTHPEVLEAAGREGEKVEDFWEVLVQAGNPGAAREFTRQPGGLMTLSEEELVRWTEAQEALGALQAWGRRDPLITRILGEPSDKVATEPVPVLPMLLKTEFRKKVLKDLQAGMTQGGRSILSGLEWSQTKLLVPVQRPGGQPLEALLVLTTLLYEGGSMRPSLIRDLMGRLDQAATEGETLPAEEFLMALLQLANQLDWGTLSEWIHLMPDVRAVQWTSKWVADHPEDRSLIFAAGLMAGDGARVVHYLIKQGPEALVWLKKAVWAGQGAVVFLLDRDRPLSQPTPAMNWAVVQSLRFPEWMITLKWLVLLAGCGFGVAGLLSFPVKSSLEAGGRSPSLVKTLALGLVGGGILIGLSEPGLRKLAPEKSTPTSGVRVEFKGLETSTGSEDAPNGIMDTTTLISVLVFLCLQVLVYFICVMKIAEIDRHEGSPLLKLRLVENEENLFDSGLYVGIGGTAAALVLQVLNVIEPNLVAAYSSNLFGITCVALVKIRKVRPFKRQMILEAEAVSPGVSSASPHTIKKPLTPFSGA